MTKIVHNGTSKVYELLPVATYNKLVKEWPAVFKSLRRRDV